MLIKTFKIVFLIIGLQLSACSFSGNNSANTQKEVADRQKLINTFSQITGTYKGQLITSSNNLVIELSLFTLETKDGVNPDGSDRFRTVLKGVLRKIDPVGNSETFLARYIPETSELILTNSNNTLSNDDTHTINSVIVGRRIIGEAKSPTGTIGQIDLKFVNSSSEKPGQSEIEETNNRIREQYNKIAGDYSGVALPPEGVMAPFAFSVRIYVTESIINGQSTPALMANYRRDDDTGGILELLLNVSYKSDLNPAKITMTGKGAMNYFVTFEGIVKGEGELLVGMTTNKGYFGTLTLKRSR